MQELIHGGDLYGLAGKVIDFSSNISPLGLPGAVRAALSSSMDAWQHYPDPLCRDLVDAIAEREEVSSDMVLCGAGAVDLIFQAVHALKPRRALLVVPSFAEYERALIAGGCEIIYHEMAEADGFMLMDDILEKITPQVDLLFLCNPNNPTGLLLRPKLLERLLKRCAECGVKLILDECFLEFVAAPLGESVKPFLRDYPNVILLKAFTKLYAMAGLRLGYLLCGDPALMEQIQGQMPPWSVSMPALIAGSVAILDEDYVWRAREYVLLERRYLQKELKKLPMKLFSSQANFFFFHCDDLGLKDKLLEQGILIRDCANYRGLREGYYRIAVKTHAENEALVAALKTLLKKGKVQ